MADEPAYPPPQPITPSAPSAPPPPSTVYGDGTGGALGGPPTAITVGRPGGGRRRWGLLVLGIVLLLFALVPVLVGAGLLLAEGAVNIADSEADGRLPDADLSFDADDAQYDIFLSGRQVNEGDSSGVNCQITLADGEQLEVDGSVQAVATEGAISSVGSFDAVEGFTEVRCTGDSTGERIYLGRDRPALERAGWISLGIGIVLLLGGVGLILLGALTRKKPKGPGFTPVPGPT